MDEEFILSYTLAKGLPKATGIESDYGSFPLDEEMRKAVEKALRPIIEKRLKKIRQMKGVGV